MFAFQFLIFQITSNDIKVCNECLCFLNEISDFLSRAKEIQKMFLELTSSQELNLNEIRSKFGLQQIPVEEDCEFIDQDNHKVIVKEELSTFESSYVEGKISNYISLLLIQLQRNFLDESEEIQDDLTDNRSTENDSQSEGEKFDSDEPFTSHAKKKRKKQNLANKETESDPNSNFE